MFAQQGSADLVLFGSSLVDHGVSAEALSQDLSAYYGRPFRVFNFSTGGGDHKTFPLIYRLMRTIAKPKGLLYLYPGSQGTSERIVPRTPEYIMFKAPVGEALWQQQLVDFSAALWRQPLVAKASAARDLFLYGELVNRPKSHLDSYRISESGDTISYFFNQHKLNPTNTLKGQRDLIEGAARCAKPEDDKDCWQAFLSHKDRDALEEVRAMAAVDGTAITVMRHDRALGYALADAQYLRAVKLALTVLGKALGTSRVLFQDGFVPRSYEYADDQHLNRYGAIRLTHRIAAAFTGREPVPETDCPFLQFETLSDPTVNPLSAAVMKPAGTATTLHVRIMQNWQYSPLLPNYPVLLSLLSPEGATIEATAAVQPDGSMTATYSNLPETCQVYIVRIQAKVQENRRPYMVPLTAEWWRN